MNFAISQSREMLEEIHRKSRVQNYLKNPFPMICKLCRSDKKPKTNTHYLSDFLIKTALNEDGVNIRGKGTYWGIDSRKLIVDFKFQQEASAPKLERLLGRKTSPEENKDAEENIDFTVSDAFCGDCEKIFTQIETEFVNKIIAKFRNSNLQNVQQKVLNDKDSRTSRLFFLLQFWRTAECTNSLKLSDPLRERIRVKILGRNDTGLEDIPLSVTYLETLKDANDKDPGNKFKTSNVVSIIDNSNPVAIIINDFVIQLYEDTKFPFFRFFGINNQLDYIQYLNQNQAQFRVKVISNKERKSILSLYFNMAAKAFVSNHAWFFLDIFTQEFKRLPSTAQIQHYLDKISKNQDVMSFSSEKLSTNVLNYLKKYYR